MPTVGDKAPDFELLNQDGKPVRLSDFRGQKVILFAFPRVFTGGCTTQACGVRDRSGDYEAAGARVLGVSPDETKDIAKFDDKYDLGFTLLADPDHAVAESYGVWAEKNMYGKRYWGVQRTTFLIDPEGKVARVFPKVQPKQHDELVLGALTELQG